MRTAEHAIVPTPHQIEQALTQLEQEVLFADDPDKAERRLVLAQEAVERLKQGPEFRLSLVLDHTGSMGQHIRAVQAQVADWLGRFRLGLDPSLLTLSNGKVRFGGQIVRFRDISNGDHDALGIDSLAAALDGDTAFVNYAREFNDHRIGGGGAQDHEDSLAALVTSIFPLDTQGRGANLLKRVNRLLVAHGNTPLERSARIQPPQAVVLVTDEKAWQYDERLERMADRRIPQDQKGGLTFRELAMAMQESQLKPDIFIISPEDGGYYVPDLGSYWRSQAGLLGATWLNIDDLSAHSPHSLTLSGLQQGLQNSLSNTLRLEASKVMNLLSPGNGR